MTSRDEGAAVVRIPTGTPGLRDAVGSADIPVVETGPTGIEALDPLVASTVDGRTALYPDCSTARASEVATAAARGALDDGDAAATVAHGADADGLPEADLRGLDVGSRRVLAGAGWRDPTDADAHAAAGGFVDVDADDVLDHAGDLLGRGWGDWCQDEPVAEDWRRAREDDATTAVVVNAHGTVADRLLCESLPLHVLDGAMLVAAVVDADRCVVYLSKDEGSVADRVREAIDAYPDAPVDAAVHGGPAVHRAAEPTMALEAIEGNHRLEARLRSPGGPLPTLDGTPALVHTARTYAHLARSVRTGEPPATRLVTVTGDVEVPATVELSPGTPLSTALDGVSLRDGWKAACVGGRFGGLTDALDVAPTPSALRDADLGTEGVLEVLGRDRCVLSFVGRRVQFAADANCGRCVPCREGSTQLAGLLRAVYDGDFDREGIAELVRTMTGSSVCAFGVAAGRPARTAVADFDAEIAAHADGRCPAGSCPDPAEVTH